MIAAATLAAALFFAAPQAHALLGGTIDANTAASEWAGVVSITPEGGGVYTGTLIDRQHVLTAAHVAARFVNDPGRLRINVNHGGDRTQTIAASRVFVHPDYRRGNRPDDGTFAWNDDIALVRLAAPVAEDVPVYPLYRGPLVRQVYGMPTGLPFKMVAYGGYADGTTNAALAPPSPTIKRVGENRIQALFPADDDDGHGAPSGVMEGYLFRFDGPGAAGYAGGDSGSPIFVYAEGAWRIAGVGAFNAGQPGLSGSALRYGAIGGGMVIAAYADWIEAQMTSVVPEPSPGALLAAGLAVLGAGARMRFRLRRFARAAAGQP